MHIGALVQTTIRRQGIDAIFQFSGTPSGTTSQYRFGQYSSQEEHNLIVMPPGEQFFTLRNSYHAITISDFKWARNSQRTPPSHALVVKAIEEFTHALRETYETSLVTGLPEFNWGLT
jgi:hypothetical protein